MGKRRKKKHSICEFFKFTASKTVKILDSGEIYFKKNDRIDISHYVDDSVNDSIISRLDGIPNKEEINIGDSSSDYSINTTINCSSIIRMVDLYSSINSTESQTIVLPMSKKRGSHLDENQIIDWLSKVSTFQPIFKRLENEWNDLNSNDKTPYTNVMYIPNIHVFVEKNGKLRRKPVNVNLVIVAFPSIKNAISGIEKMDEIDYTNRIINDTMEACIRLGVHEIVIDPFYMTALQNDVHYTSKYWAGYIERQRTIENIKNISFAIDNDDLFIIFCKNKDS